MNEAPWPTELEDLVAKVRYRAGWTFTLTHMDRGQGSSGLTLDIVTKTANSYHERLCEFCRSPVTDYRVHHLFIVPAAAYNRQSWRRWLLERIFDVERHEACEFCRFEWDSIGTLGVNHHVERPYAPNHGFGHDPYFVFEVGSEKDQRTSFRNEVKPRD